MRIRWILSVATVALCSSTVSAQSEEVEILGRGDTNNDGVVDVSDITFLSTYLQDNEPEPPCMNQADCDDDGDVEGSDASYLANFLFNGGPPPPAPGPENAYGECIADTTTPNLGCEANCSDVE